MGFFDIFFNRKKEKDSSERKKTSNGSTRGNTYDNRFENNVNSEFAVDDKYNAYSEIKDPSGNEFVNANKTRSSFIEDVNDIAKQTEETDYIANLCIGRYWVFPQMVRMGFHNKDFDKQLFLKNISEEYYLKKSLKLVARNLNALAVISDKDKEAYRMRARWWTKEVAIAMVKADFDFLCNSIKRKCKYNEGYRYIRIRQNGKYRSLLIKEPIKRPVKHKTVTEFLALKQDEYDMVVKSLQNAANDKELSDEFNRYLRNRWRYVEIGNYAMPQEFLNAFLGDGAYCAMNTMVKYHNLTYDGLGRQKCLDDITNKALTLDGLSLLNFCMQKFFNGNFEVSNYKKI